MTGLLDSVCHSFTENSAPGVEMKHGPRLGARDYDANDGNAYIRPGQVKSDDFGKPPFPQLVE
jgi:hypothetical protein